MFECVRRQNVWMCLKTKCFNVFKDKIFECVRSQNISQYINLMFVGPLGLQDSFLPRWGAEFGQCGTVRWGWDISWFGTPSRVPSAALKWRPSSASDSCLHSSPLKWSGMRWPPLLWPSGEMHRLQDRKTLFCSTKGKV